MLGVIALTYGIALGVAAYGFLAAFAAGLAVRTIERQEADPVANAAAPIPEHSATGLASRLLTFTEQIERLAELGVVLLVGILLTHIRWSVALVTFIALMLLVVRPAAVALVLTGATVGRSERRLLGWFGVRGVGSLYYLSYALGRDLPPTLAAQLIDATLGTIAASIVLHGVSATPLMRRYEAIRTRRRQRRIPAKSTATLKTLRR